MGVRQLQQELVERRKVRAAEDRDRRDKQDQKVSPNSHTGFPIPLFSSAPFQKEAEEAEKEEQEEQEAEDSAIR